MAKLVWDAIGTRYFETGVDRGVLYLLDDENAYSKGVAWNGLTNVSESPSGAEPTDLWADNIKYATLRSAESFGATIEAYTYPDEFALCDGSNELVPGVTVGQQNRKSFGFAYRTMIGSDIDPNASSYKLHLVYGASASPSEKAYATINDSPDAITFSWELTTTPVNVNGMKPTALVTIDSRRVKPEKLAALEAILYGSESAEPRLPLPDEIVTTIGTETANVG